MLAEDLSSGLGAALGAVAAGGKAQMAQNLNVIGWVEGRGGPVNLYVPVRFLRDLRRIFDGVDGEVAAYQVARGVRCRHARTQPAWGAACVS